MTHITAFSDELAKIASQSYKLANLGVQPTQSQVEAPPPRALGVAKPKTISKKPSVYARPQNVTAPAPIAANYQPTSPAPKVTT